MKPGTRGGGEFCTGDIFVMMEQFYTELHDINMTRKRHVFGMIFIFFIIASTSQASNFSALLNPIGLLQQAGQTVMSKLMRSSPPAEPRPLEGKTQQIKPGSEMADRVASLVTNGLGENKKQPNKKQGKPQQNKKQDQSGGGLFGGFMRLLGLDSTRLGAIAINAVVYVSEIIAATLTRMNPPMSGTNRDDLKKPEGSPFSWLLDNPGPKIAAALKLAQDRELPEMLITLLSGRAKRSLDDDNIGPTWCLQRLVCQLTPVLWGMQKAVGDTISTEPAFKEAKTPINSLWLHLPTKDALKQQGERCETRFPECELPQPGDM